MCKISGRFFGHLPVFDQEEEAEEGEELAGGETTLLKEEEGEEEKQSKTPPTRFLNVLKRMFSSSSVFPFDAYLMELQRLYEEYHFTKTTAEDFVLGTIYIMAEGLQVNNHVVCEKNEFLFETLPTSPMFLKKQNLEISSITRGKKQWREMCLCKQEDEDEEEITFNTRTNTTVKIRSHAEILHHYEKVVAKNKEHFMFL